MSDAPPQIYLASQSPRRRALLDQIQVRYHVLSTAVHEQVADGELPAAYVQRVALDKARAGWSAAERILNLPVLGADTEVIVQGMVLGKPSGRAHGLELLRSLSGRSHEVLSAVAMVQGKREQVALSRSRVWFRELSDAEMEAYWDTGEPAGKAGAYAIQGRGATFVQRLDGSYSAVMGLALYETSRLLGCFGVNVLAAP